MSTTASFGVCLLLCYTLHGISGDVALQPLGLTKLPTQARSTVLIDSNVSIITYALVIWAFMRALIALVSALRESSIVFALPIGVCLLTEKLNLAKIVAMFMTLLGVMLLKLSR